MSILLAHSLAAGILGRQLAVMADEARDVDDQANSRLLGWLASAFVGAAAEMRRATTEAHVLTEEATGLAVAGTGPDHDQPQLNPRQLNPVRHLAFPPSGR